LKATGGDEGLRELDGRRPMAKARRDELAAAARRVPMVVGYAAHRPSAEVEECIRLVRLHVKKDARRVHEYVAPDDSLIDSPDGRLLNPGHAIEAGWFLQHWARRLGREDLSREAIDVVRWSFAEGWDGSTAGSSHSSTRRAARRSRSSGA
jgi:mannose/cellobiose epimerase-like protein (N-acyl-D-glucosamine 2-epimerase family)